MSHATNKQLQVQTYFFDPFYYPKAHKNPPCSPSTIPAVALSFPRHRGRLHKFHRACLFPRLERRIFNYRGPIIRIEGAPDGLAILRASALPYRVTVPDCVRRVYETVTEFSNRNNDSAAGFITVFPERRGARVRRATRAAPGLYPRIITIQLSLLRGARTTMRGRVHNSP